MPDATIDKKSPSDMLGVAIKVAQIAKGEAEDAKAELSSAAAQMGRKGGRARASKLTAEQRSTIAKKAAQKRWETKTQE